MFTILLYDHGCHAWIGKWCKICQMIKLAWPRVISK